VFVGQKLTFDGANLRIKDKFAIPLTIVNIIEE
jgi:hypothetical protein